MTGRQVLASLLLIGLSTQALADEMHLTEPRRYDQCASEVLASGSVPILYFPQPIEAVACGDETWGCFVGGTIIVSNDAPLWLKPWVLMHEAAHSPACGWGEHHPGGRIVEVGPQTSWPALFPATVALK